MEVMEYGAGPAIILLHGAGVDANQWAPQIEAFCRDHRLLVFTLPGHGASPMVAGGIPAMAEAVHAQIKKRCVERYAVVGMSLGGMVALEIAGRWPEEVTRLVLAESVARVSRSVLGRNVAGLAIQLFRVVPPRWLAMLPAGAMGARTRSAGMYVKHAIARMSRKNAYLVMKAALDYDGVPRLAQVQARTLVLVGALNRHTHRRARFMADRIKAARFVMVPDAAHILNRDNAEFFNRVVLDFIDGS